MCRCINYRFSIIPCYKERAQNDIVNPEFITLLISVMNSPFWINDIILSSFRVAWNDGKSVVVV